ncbi:MAG TPA: hypothetical protein VGK64_24925 [Bryobacteraceae bacterium]
MPAMQLETGALNIRFRRSFANIASGVTISNCYRWYRHQEFLRFLYEIEENLPAKVGRAFGDG